MTKTANYQLNQWEKSDRIQMEDFNADNTKIDAALNNFSLLNKIREITTSAAASSIDVDISDISWNDWNFVLLRFDPNYGSSIFYYSTEINYGKIANGSGYAPNYIVFFPMKNAANQVSAFGVAGAEVSGGNAGIAYSAMKHLYIYAPSGNGGIQFLAGAKLTFWGVK